MCCPSQKEYAACLKEMAGAALTLGVQNVNEAMPTFDITRASVPIADPIWRNSVRLNEAELVMAAGNDVGHFDTPSRPTAQHLPNVLALALV